MEIVRKLLFVALWCALAISFNRQHGLILSTSAGRSEHEGSLSRKSGYEASLSRMADNVSAEHDLIRDGIPGQPPVNFKQYSGYVTVNASAGRALFYWLVEADVPHPEEKPLILWLNGGPGCSSIAYGAMEEIGPFNVLPNTAGLVRNNNTWNKVTNILFLESPAGVGFSYSNTSSDLTTVGDKRTAKDSHIFLMDWFERFPQYKGREFYITGESYAGHYIPQLAELVYEKNVKAVKKPEINLKGILVGNGVLDNYYDNMGLIEFWWDHALIPNDLYHNILSSCDFHKANWSEKCNQFMDTAYDNDLSDIDPYSIYSPVCPKKLVKRRVVARRATNNPKRRQLAGYDPCLENYAEVYFNRPDVQKALHANTTGISYNWTACSDPIFQNWQDADFSVIPIYKKLISAGLKIWMFSGDVDAVVPITGTRYGVESMNLTKTEQWFSWFTDGQVAGRCQVFQGLSVVTVTDAGHEVPYTQPRRAFVLIESFLTSNNTKPMLPRKKT